MLDYSAVYNTLYKASSILPVVLGQWIYISEIKTTYMVIVASRIWNNALNSKDNYTGYRYWNYVYMCYYIL